MSSTPHLLTLPRELRDLIYNDVTHSVVGLWMWHDMGCWYPIDLTIECAPVPGVFQTCAQIDGEYKEAPCNEDLSLRLSLNFDVDKPESAAAFDYFNGEYQQRAEDALGHTRHAIIYLKEAYGDYKYALHSCLRACLAMMPNLLSLRIALEKQCPYETDEYELGVKIEPASERENFLPSLPNIFGNLRGFQASEGYVIRRRLPQVSPSTTTNWLNDHVSKVGVYTWSVNARTAEKRL